MDNLCPKFVVVTIYDNLRFDPSQAHFWFSLKNNYITLHIFA